MNTKDCSALFGMGLSQDSNFLTHMHLSIYRLRQEQSPLFLWCLLCVQFSIWHSASLVLFIFNYFILEYRWLRTLFYFQMYRKVIQLYIYMCVHIYTPCYMFAKSLQSCQTLCDPMDCSPPGSSVHGVLQARILEWVAVPSSRGSSWPRDRTHVSWVSCIGRQIFYH